MTATMPARLPIGDAELFVAEPVGGGEPLVLVHGAWTGAGTWGLLVAPLAAHFRGDRL